MTEPPRPNGDGTPPGSGETPGYGRPPTGFEPTTGAPAPQQPAPGYQQPPPGYQQPPPGYQQPPPGYQQPPAGHQQPPPGYQQPPPGYQQPPPGYQQPPPGYQQPGYQQPPAGYQPPPPGYQQPGPNPGAGVDDKTWTLFPHFGGALGALVFWGVGGFIAPLVVFLVKGNQSPAVRAHALVALNFQIITSAVGFIGYVLSQSFFGFGGWTITTIAAICGIVFGIVAGLKANNGEFPTYPLNQHFVK